jgi:hypothetical protein
MIPNLRRPDISDPVRKLDRRFRAGGSLVWQFWVPPKRELFVCFDFDRSADLRDDDLKRANFVLAAADEGSAYHWPSFEASIDKATYFLE